MTCDLSIGVVIRTKDRPLFLERAILSVNDQSYSNWKAVIVNDGGSIPEINKLFSKLQSENSLNEDKFTIINNKTNVGRSEAFNIGMNSLDTHFVSCLDDDDTWKKDFMECLIAFYKEMKVFFPEIGGVSSFATAINEYITTDRSGAQAIKIVGESNLTPAFRREDLILNRLSFSAYRLDIYPVQWLLERSKAQEAGGFPAHLDVMEDRAFLLRFLGLYDIARLNVVLAHHHCRTAHHADTSRGIDQNTINNPSYDWRVSAGVAEHYSNNIHTDDDSDASVLKTFIFRNVRQLLFELNREARSLWEKLDTIQKDLEGSGGSEGSVVGKFASQRKNFNENFIKYDIFKDNEKNFGRERKLNSTFLDYFFLSCKGWPALFSRGSATRPMLYLNRGDRVFQIQVSGRRRNLSLYVRLETIIDIRENFTVEIEFEADRAQLFETAFLVNNGRGPIFNNPKVGRRFHSARRSSRNRISREFSTKLCSGDVKSISFAIMAPKIVDNYLLTLRHLKVIQKDKIGSISNQ